MALIAVCGPAGLCAAASSSGLRLARPADRPVFRSLVMDYLVEMRSKGSEIQPTEKTVDFYCSLFDAYTSGDKEGVIVFAPAYAFSMAGDATMPIDTDFGKTAVGWATYVSPGSRGRDVASILRSSLRSHLRTLGFQTILGGVYTSDTAAAASTMKTGWRPYMLQGFDDLRREEERS